jgi:hypothetical protein
MLDGIKGILKQLENWGSEHQLYYTVLEALDRRDKPGLSVQGAHNHLRHRSLVRDLCAATAT